MRVGELARTPKGHGQSWTSLWENKTAPSAPQCTARPPTQTNTCLSSPIIQRHVRELLSGHCCIQLRSSCHQVWAGLRSRNMWPKPFRGMDTPPVSSVSTPVQHVHPNARQQWKACIADPSLPPWIVWVPLQNAEPFSPSILMTLQQELMHSKDPVSIIHSWWCIQRSLAGLKDAEAWQTVPS